MFVALLAYIKNPDVKSQLLLITSLAYLMQVRQEFVVFVPFALLTYLIFKLPTKHMRKYIKKSATRLGDSKFLLPWILFLILITPQILQINEKMVTDTTTRELGGYFNKNSVSFNWNHLIAPMIFTGEFQPFIINILALFGLLLIFRNNKRAGLFLTSFFITFILFFLMVRELHLRMILLLYIAPIILCGYGFSEILKFIDQKFGKPSKKIAKPLITAIIISLVLFSFLAFRERIYYNRGFPQGIESEDFDFYYLETEIERSLSSKNLIPENCYVISTKPGVIEFIPKIKTIEIGQMKEFLPSLLKKDECVLFFEDFCCFIELETMCTYNHAKELCEYLHEKYDLDIFLQYNHGKATFTFYNLSEKRLEN